MSACWKVEETARPSFIDIRESLLGMIKNSEVWITTMIFNVELVSSKGTKIDRFYALQYHYYLDKQKYYHISCSSSQKSQKSSVLEWKKVINISIITQQF